MLQAAFPLEYTPRRFVVNAEGGNARLFIIESDHNAYTEATKQARKQVMAEEMKEAAGEDEQVKQEVFLYASRRRQSNCLGFKFSGTCKRHG